MHNCPTCDTAEQDSSIPDGFDNGYCWELSADKEQAVVGNVLNTSNRQCEQAPTLLGRIVLLETLFKEFRQEARQSQQQAASFQAVLRQHGNELQQSQQQI